MIMILSDSDKKYQEIKQMLDRHHYTYFFYFSDIISAARYGKGDTIIGEVARDAIRETCRLNNVNVIIDILDEPSSKLSEAAISVCKKGIKYIKCVTCEKHDGMARCLSYSSLAEKIDEAEKNTLIYASSNTVAAISRLLKDENKLFIAKNRDMIFDIENALSYSIPIFNIIELDMTGTNDDILSAIEKSNAELVVFAQGYDTDEAVEAALDKGVKVFKTHDMGLEYKNTVASVVDAIAKIKE